MNCVIVHGCPSQFQREEKDRTYAKHWMPWIKKELTLKGIITEIALMPEPWFPDYNKFKEEFEKYKVDQNTILIGHSCGTSFLVRWLGETKRKVSMLVMVAPWKVANENDRYRKEFYGHQIDEAIRERVGKIIMFTSDNEDSNGKKSLEIFHKALGGEIIELKGRGHFTLNDMGTEEFPELITKVLEN